jgi:hypothetical protein
MLCVTLAALRGLELTETDTFRTRVYPRNEFVQTNRDKTSSIGCYCPDTG